MRKHEDTRQGRLRRGWAKVAGLALLAGLAWPTGGHAQTSGGSIVEEAIKDAQQDQARDSERVRRMVDEAVKGAEQAPSGKEQVNPTAPDHLRPMQGEVPGSLPAGYQPEDLVGKPVRDGSGTQIGTVRGLVLDEASGLARVVIAFGPLFGQPGKTSVMEIGALRPATDGSDGFAVELTPVQYEAMPAYVQENAVWRRAGG